jgi:hypothetical protein
MQNPWRKTHLSVLAVATSMLQPLALHAAARNDGLCLDAVIRSVILELDVTEVARRPPPSDPDMHTFYLPGAKPCTTNGGYAAAGGPPKAISLYLSYRESHGEAAYCPQPFSPVRIYAEDAERGCRPVAAPSANACALKAFVGQGDATISVARDADQVTDLEFVSFLRGYIPLNPKEFPEYSQCLRH